MKGLFSGLWRAAEVAVSQEPAQDPWFTGYETSPRWLRLVRSAVGIRSVADGFAIQTPDDESLQSTIVKICSRHGVVDADADAIRLRIRHHDCGGEVIDAVDRVVVGAALLKDLTEAGL